MADTQKDNWLDRYLERARRIAQEEHQRNSQSSEGGGDPAVVDWESMSLQDLLRNAGGRLNEAQSVMEDDPIVQQFTAQFGSAPEGGLQFSFDAPVLYGHGADEWMKDPTRIMKLPDGRYVWETGNVRGDVLAQYQSEDDDSGLGDSDAWWRAGLGTVLGGGMLNNYLSGGDLLGLGTGAEGSTGMSLEDLVLENFLTPAADVSLDAAPDIFSLTGGSNWAELGAGAGGLAPEEMGIANYLAGPGQAPGLWDTLSQYGGRFLDRLPALANAARYMIPSQQPQLGGGAPPGGSGGHIASAARGLGGSGGQGGMGTSGVDMGKLKELLSLAAYLGGRR